MGRETKLTDEIQNIILKGLEGHLTIKLASHYAGVTDRSVYEWLERGKDDKSNGLDTIYSRFLHAVNKSRSDAAFKLLSRIDFAAHEPKTWAAGAWLLERVQRGCYALNGDIAEKLTAKIEELERKLEKRLDNFGDQHGKEMDSQSNKE